MVAFRVHKLLICVPIHKHTYSRWIKN